MPKKNKDKKENKQEKDSLIEKNIKKNEKGKKNKKEKTKKEKVEKEEKPDRIDLNVYNLLFDEINLFLKEIDTKKMKEIKQRLILLDGKMIWIEKESEEDLFVEDDQQDEVDMEMEMLELGLDLDNAEDLTDMYEATAEDFDLNVMKKQLEETKSWGDNLKELIKDIENDDITKPVDELMSKFVLFDLRAILERAVNEVFKLEGAIKEKIKQGEEKDKVKLLLIDQRLAVKKSLKEILDKLKKEKPELLLTEEKLNIFKRLTHKEIVEMKAEEEQAFDQMVDELLKD